MMHLHLIKVCSLIYRTLSQLRFLLYLRALAPIFFRTFCNFYVLLCREKVSFLIYRTNLHLRFSLYLQGFQHFFLLTACKFCGKVKYKSSSSHILDEFALVLLVDFTTFLGTFEKITVSKYRQKSYSPHIPHEFAFTIFAVFTMV